MITVSTLPCDAAAIPVLCPEYTAAPGVPPANPAAGGCASHGIPDTLDRHCAASNHRTEIPLQSHCRKPLTVQSCSEAHGLGKRKQSWNQGCSSAAEAVGLWFSWYLPGSCQGQLFEFRRREMFGRSGLYILKQDQSIVATSLGHSGNGEDLGLCQKQSSFKYTGSQNSMRALLFLQPHLFRL